MKTRNSAGTPVIVPEHSYSVYLSASAAASNSPTLVSDPNFLPRHSAFIQQGSGYVEQNILVYIPRTPNCKVKIIFKI